MSEQKLREALGNLGPNDETRQRLLQNILAAAEEETALPDGVQSVPTLRPKESRQTQSKKRRKFSLIKYALPVAACLVLAAALPNYLPQLVEILNNPPANEQIGIPNNGTQHEELPSTVPNEVPSIGEPVTPQIDNESPQASSPETDIPPVVEATTPSALAPSEHSWSIHLISDTLGALALLLAFVFAVLGIIAWRRSKKISQ